MQLNWKSPAIRLRLQETIFMMTGPYLPPIKLIDAWIDTDSTELQDFCYNRARIQWVTGISVIETAYMLVEAAFENGNIDENGNVLL